jgi:hypothetical protein
MSVSKPGARRLTSTRPQGSTAGEPASATRVLAGTATIYLVGGRSDYIVRAPGDVDRVDIDSDHAAQLEESFATEAVPLSSTPAWPELSEREFDATAST